MILGLPVVLGVMRLLVFKLVYKEETPIYLYIIGKTDEALDILKRMYKEEYIEEEYENL